MGRVGQHPANRPGQLTASGSTRRRSRLLPLAGRRQRDGDLQVTVDDRIDVGGQLVYLILSLIFPASPASRSNEIPAPKPNQDHRHISAIAASVPWSPGLDEPYKYSGRTTVQYLFFAIPLSRLGSSLASSPNRGNSPEFVNGAATADHPGVLQVV
jgi:hypothetical protein